MKKKDLNKLISLCERELSKGTEINTILCYLKTMNISIIDAMKVIREAKKTDLGEAKRLVTSNACWSVEAEQMVAFGEVALNRLMDEDEVIINGDSFEINIDLNEQ